MSTPTLIPEKWYHKWLSDPENYPPSLVERLQENIHAGHVVVIDDATYCKLHGHAQLLI